MPFHSPRRSGTVPYLTRQTGLSRGGWILAVLWLTLACETTDAIVFPPDPATPLPVAGRPGIFRLTFNRHDDLFPVWLDTALVGYRGENLAGVDSGLRLLARSVHGGPSTERERALVAQIRGVPAVPVSTGAAALGTYLWLWSVPPNGVLLCAEPCPGAAAHAITVYRTDDAATVGLFRLPSWTVETGRLDPGGGVRPTLRLLPADFDARDRGTNPFGPAISRTTEDFYLSNGEVVYHAVGDSDAPPDSVTTGSYPALSPDGSMLAFTRIAVVDSSTSVCSTPGALGSCGQTTVELHEGGREVWLRTLADGTERLVTTGEQPEFHPAGDRLIVVRPDGLLWIDVTTGAETLLPNTAGAHSPRVSPGADYVAFVARWADQADVYFLRIADALPE